MGVLLNGGRGASELMVTRGWRSARGEMAERNSCRQDAQAAGCVPPSFEEYRYGSIDVSGTSAPELSSWDNGAALACFFGMVPKVAERKLPTLLWSHRARDETAS